MKLNTQHTSNFLSLSLSLFPPLPSNPEKPFLSTYRQFLQAPARALLGLSVAIAAAAAAAAVVVAMISERRRGGERRWKTSLYAPAWSVGIPSKQQRPNTVQLADAARLRARARRRNRVRYNGPRDVLVVRFLRKVFGLKFAVQRRMLTQHRLVAVEESKTNAFCFFRRQTRRIAGLFNAFLAGFRGNNVIEERELFLGKEVVRAIAAFARDFHTRWKKNSSHFIPRQTRLQQHTGDGYGIHGMKSIMEQWLVS